MKSLLLILSFILGSTAFANENIVCLLKSRKDSAQYVSVKVDLANLSEDAYISKDGLDIGKSNYSFDMTIERKGKSKSKFTIYATFYENNHVQDEVTSGGWDIDLKEAKDGEPLFTEPLNDDDKTVMDFLCYYNR